MPSAADAPMAARPSPSGPHKAGLLHSKQHSRVSSLLDPEACKHDMLNANKSQLSLPGQAGSDDGAGEGEGEGENKGQRKTIDTAEAMRSWPLCIYTYTASPVSLMMVHLTCTLHLHPPFPPNRSLIAPCPLHKASPNPPKSF